MLDHALTHIKDKRLFYMREQRGQRQSLDKKQTTSQYFSINYIRF